MRVTDLLEDNLLIDRQPPDVRIEERSEVQASAGASIDSVSSEHTGNAMREAFMGILFASSERVSWPDPPEAR